MGNFSFIIDLPEDLQQALEAKIASGEPVVRINAWLNEELNCSGMTEVKYSTLAYNVRKKRQDLQAKAREQREVDVQARAFAQAFKHSGTSMRVMVKRILEAKLTQKAHGLEIDDSEPLSPKDLKDITQALKNLADIEEAEQRRLDADVSVLMEKAKLVSGEVKQLVKGGITDESVEQIMEKVLGATFLPNNREDTPNE